MFNIQFDSSLQKKKKKKNIQFDSKQEKEKRERRKPRLSSHRKALPISTAPDIGFNKKRKNLKSS